MSGQTAGDEKAVEDIVYKLKSQGLFDQLRKECLNDVDTKPAYQNLRQRVESYVARFLSQQTWSPELNKNQLRDSLRRQINQSGMLSSGVERIIEQVVNPKIFTVIKPKIDEIVCKHLGIDPEERKRQQEERKTRQQQIQKQQFQQQQEERLQQAPSISEPQPLMSLTTSVAGPVPGYDSLPGAGGNMYTAYSPSANWHRPFGTMLNPHLNSNYQVNHHYPQGYGSYGMASPLYPYIQQGWAIPPFPGMPPMFPQQPPPPIPPGTGSDVAPAVPAPQFTEPPPPLPTEPYAAVEHMETVPAPPPEPEPSTSELTPPGITPVTLPAAPPPKPEKPEKLKAEKVESSKVTEMKKEKEKPKKTESKSKSESKPADGTYNILKDIPLPIPLPGRSESGYQPGKESKRKANGGNGSRGKDKPSSAALDKGKEKTKDSGAQKEVKETENKTESEKKGAEKAKSSSLDCVSKGKNDSSTKASKLSGEKHSGSQTSKPASQHIKQSKEHDKHKESKESTTKFIEKPSSKDSDSKDEESKEKTDVVKASLTAENLEKLSATEHPKQYTFSWTKGDEVSSITVSSVHTSDLSSFEDEAAVDSDVDSEDTLSDEKEMSTEKPEDIAVSTGESADVSGSQSESVEVTSPMKPASAETAAAAAPAPVDVQTATPRPKKLISLMYNYSDSDDDETREERKARIAREKEERYAKRLQRRAELDAKRKEREEEKVRIREEKKKNRLSDSDKKTQSDESEAAKGASSSSEPQKSEESEEKPATVPASPKKKTKRELKEQLREQKVMEKKLALRRQRTRNKRYTSEEFTSIFTEKQQPFSSQSYTNIKEESVKDTSENAGMAEDAVMVEETVVVEEETVVVEETALVEDKAMMEDSEVVEDAVPEELSGVAEITGVGQDTSITESTDKPSGGGDTPENSPGSPKSPATPTQDEPCVYPVPEGTSSLPTGIPVYEITAAPTTTLTIGQVIHETRSRTRKLSDERKSNETHSTGRPGSPFSDISETSKPESIGDSQERRPKRRRMDSISPGSAEGTISRTRRSSGVSPSEAHKVAAEGSDVRTRGKRYSVDDLYKPRTIHRRSLSPPPSPPATPKTPTSSSRRRSPPSAESSTSGPGRRLHHPSPPPLSAPNTTKRYDAEDLYKPRQPSSRSSRYLQRQEPSTAREELGKRSRHNDKKGDNFGKDGGKRELPFAAKEMSDEESVEEGQESAAEIERKRHKRPIALVDFGEAARRTDRGPPQGEKFRGHAWGKGRPRMERKGQRKYFDAGWSLSDVEKTGSKSPASSHSSGSGGPFSTSRPGWKDSYDSEPGLLHRSGSHSPSKLSRSSMDMVDRPPSPSGRCPSSPPSPGMRRMPSPGLRRPPSPSSRRPPSPLSPARGMRRPPSPTCQGMRRPPSPPSPGVRRPPSPPSPGVRRPPSPPSAGVRRPPSPPSPGMRRPPSPPSPGLRRSLSPPSDLGPRTRRHRPASPDFSRSRRPPNPPPAPPPRRTTRNSLYHPVMTSPTRGRGWASKERGWGGRQPPTSSQGGRYLRSRSPTGGRRQPPGPHSGRGGKSRRDASPPPAKRPKR